MPKFEVKLLPGEVLQTYEVSSRLAGRVSGYKTSDLMIARYKKNRARYFKALRAEMGDGKRFALADVAAMFKVDLLLAENIVSYWHLVPGLEAKRDAIVRDGKPAWGPYYFQQA